MKPDDSIIVDYALQFYAALKKASKTEKKQTVFRGKITPVYDSLGGSRSYYGRIVKGLEEIGAIVFVQRGNSRQESIVVLTGAPTREALAAIDHLTKPSDRRRMSGSDLEKRVEALERSLGKDINIVEALLDIERRLTALEGRNG